MLLQGYCRATAGLMRSAGDCRATASSGLLHGYCRATCSRKTPCEWQPLASADVIDSATRRADGSRSPWARSARRQSECSSPTDSRGMQDSKTFAGRT